MTTENVIAGLTILAPYYDKNHIYSVGADHDIIYGYATDRELNPEDVQKMIDLGWHQESDDMDYNKDFSAEDYRKDESWCAYL